MTLSMDDPQGTFYACSLFTLGAEAPMVLSNQQELVEEPKSQITYVRTTFLFNQTCTDHLAAFNFTLAVGLHGSRTFITRIEY
jgi:hypothetical protein